MTRENTAYKKVKVEDAVGLALAHDITEIRPNEFKGVSFQKGHMVKKTDICHLMRLGKRHLYILDLDETKIHEDEAVAELVQALAGPGVEFQEKPREGKLELRAAHDGLLKINVEALIDFNMIPEVMCAAIHTNTPVKKGEKIAGTRAIPLVIQREILDKALAIALSNTPIFEVLSFKPMRARLVITGSEVYDGLIEDKFEAIVKKKVEALGSCLAETIILPDNRQKISSTIKSFLDKETDILITTGGMSVDPDDVTRHAIQDAGADQIHYSAAALPGAMFQLAYCQGVPIIGIPACGLFHEATVFDIIFPRLLAGERPDNRDLARLAHGGLCLDCTICSYPKCSFGKTL